MPILYDIFFVCFALAYLPYAAVRGKLHRGLIVRLGFLPAGARRRLTGKRNVWVHAVSVGEVAAIESFVRRLHSRFPAYQIVLTTGTVTGYGLAVNRLGDACVVLFAPLDFSLTVREYVRRIKPVAYLAAETEIWPNLFHVLSRKNVPILQVNGRMSDGAFVHYRRVRFLFRPVLRRVAVFAMQTPEDARRMIELGASEGAVRVTGNFKFDMEPIPPVPPEKEGGPLWLAGSTHPGEEEIVLETYRRLREEFPALRLVIAPRHVERAAQVAKLAQKSGLDGVMLSQGEDGGRSSGTVLIVDTIGQLRGLYARADVVFMGKSLTARGGQNMIEPAFCGKPVVVGPFTENFRDVVERLTQRNAIVRIGSGAELAQAVGRLLRDPQERARIGGEARRMVLESQGATERTLELVGEYLAPRTA